MGPLRIAQFPTFCPSALIPVEASNRTLREQGEECGLCSSRKGTLREGDHQSVPEGHTRQGREFVSVQESEVKYSGVA